MARSRWTFATPTEVAIATAGNSYSIIQVRAPSSGALVPVAIKGFSISFDGQTVTAAPNVVQLTLDGASAATTAMVPAKEHSVATQCYSTGFVGANTIAVTSTLRSYNVHPQTGLEVRFSPEDEIIIQGSSDAGRLSLRTTVGAAVNCHAHITIEE